MMKHVFGTIILTGVGVGVALFGGWVLEAAYARWVMTEGFWQAVLSDVQFGIGASFIVLIAQALPNIPKKVPGNGAARLIHAIGALVVCVVLIYCAWPSFGFGKLCWWEGFFSTIYSLTAFAFAVTVIGSSIAGVVLCIRAVVKK